MVGYKEIFLAFDARVFLLIFFLCKWMNMNKGNYCLMSLSNHRIDWHRNYLEQRTNVFKDTFFVDEFLCDESRRGEHSNASVL